MVKLASRIVAIFAAICVFYMNQFKMKRSKKEIALYGVLGMSKRNIRSLMTIEMIVNSALCLFTGTILGSLLNGSMLVLLFKVVKQEPVAGAYFSLESFLYTIVLFMVINTLCLIYNVCSIQVGNPIELLHSDKEGEKEPKIKKLLLAVGIITLGCGYFLALRADSTEIANKNLLLSIILVATATYCLFIEGSIFILKSLKKNKKFYFKTRNYLSVSNLIFRIKHNAVGLASICLLSTGVIILLTCGLSLMMLGEKNINEKYPTDVKISTESEETKKNIYTDTVTEAAHQSGIELSKLVFREYRNTIANKAGNSFSFLTSNGITNISDSRDMYFLNIDDYNDYAGTQISLKTDQILIYQSDESKDNSEVSLFGNKYTVVGQADYEALHYIINPSMALFDKVIIVFSNRSELSSALKGDTYNNNEQYNVYMGFNLNNKIGTKEISAFTDSMNNSGLNCDVHFKAMDRIQFYSIYGGAFFTGIFLSVIFLVATVLIIYYKQISEGYEDQRRFEIYVNVGLTRKEVKNLIKRQTLILFYLPIITATLHAVIASKIIRLFLRTVLYVEPLTFAISIVSVCLVFWMVYVIIYRITSIQYYQICLPMNDGDLV